jgi:hypothetical protein
MKNSELKIHFQIPFHWRIPFISSHIPVSEDFLQQNTHTIRQFQQLHFDSYRPADSWLWVCFKQITNMSLHLWIPTEIWRPNAL